MQRTYRVRFDTDHMAVTRLVRSKWSMWEPGSIVEVDIGTAEYGSEQWVEVRIERRVGETLMVTRCAS